MTEEKKEQAPAKESTPKEVKGGDVKAKDATTSKELTTNEIIVAAPKTAAERKAEKRGYNNKRRGGGPHQKRRSFDDEEKEAWVPKTTIGRKVLSGEITDIDDILDAGSQIMEAGIVDLLLPELQEEVINVRRVQRTLDSGRRMRFSILVVVGDKNGHVGVGLAKGVEAGPTIKKAITQAKLNIIHVNRSCASWECGCGEPHTVPFKVSGKKGSVCVVLKPAPKGVGLVAGNNSKTVLNFAGIQDIWAFSRGHTRTVINQVLAVHEALKSLSNFKSEASLKLEKKKSADTGNIKK